MDGAFWVYEDRIRRRATVHRSDCPYCSDGKGFHHLVSGRVGGEWSGPFFSAGEADSFAVQTERPVHKCGHCMAGAVSGRPEAGQTPQ